MGKHTSSAFPDIHVCERWAALLGVFCSDPSAFPVHLLLLGGCAALQHPLDSLCVNTFHWEFICALKRLNLSRKAESMSEMGIWRNISADWKGHRKAHCHLNCYIAKVRAGQKMRWNCFGTLICCCFPRLLCLWHRQ